MRAEAVDAAEMPPAEEPSGVPMREILEQHRRRYIVHTEHGDVVLKHATREAVARLDRLRRQLWPQVPEWEDELRLLGKLASTGDCDPSVTERMGELANLLLPTTDVTALACIVEPEVRSVEELRVMMDALEPEEAEAVRQLLLVCTAHAGKVDTGYLEIAERFGVQVVTRELLDNMTIQQYEVLQSVLRAERTREARLLKSLGVKR